MRMGKNTMSDLRRQIESLQLDEDLYHISDDNAYFIYKIMDATLHWWLKRYQHKITRVLLHRYHVEVEKGYDPNQHYDDDDVDLDEAPPF